MREALPIAVIAVTLMGGGRAFAQTAREATPAAVRAAADAFDRGREAYKSGDPVVAAEAFELADSKAASPVALEYAIRSRDKAGQLDRAATLAALAKALYPGEPALLRLSEEVLARTRPDSYEVRVTCSEPCDLVVDGKLVHGPASIERVVFVVEGEHTLRAGFPRDRSDSKTLLATPGQQGEAHFDAPAEHRSASAPSRARANEPVAARAASDDPALSEGQAAEERSSGLPPAVFWVGASVTTVLGGIALWSGLDTVKNPGEDKVREACRNNQPDCRDLYEDGRKRQDRTNLLLGVTGGVGIATILVGAMLTNWSDTSERPQAGALRARERAGVEPFISLGNAALVGAEGRF
jgi:hypothetical protein